jgi:hypothetical protein
MATTLFDDFERSDASPQLATEDNFAFLNRAATPFFAEVRSRLEEWFTAYPKDEAPELRENFRSRLPGQHWGAWWELYLHELFTRLGYELTIHPRLPDSTKRPDFEMRRGQSRIYLEAAVVFSGIVSEDDDPQAPPWMIDAVNDVQSSNFFIGIVEVESAGPERLRNRQISSPLQAWLDGLDPDDVERQYERGDGFPQRTITRRGWEVVFEAYPVKREARAKPIQRVLGMGPVEAGLVDDIEQLHSKLKAKAGRYGRPEVPFVTAILCMSSFMERLDIEQALFGREAVVIPSGPTVQARLVRQRNGFWMHGETPQNRRVSAVLTAVGLHPSMAPRVTPRLWRNPWADHPLTEDWPFPEATADDRGQIVYREAAPDMHALLGLSPDWPGGEPFPRSH